MTLTIVHGGQTGVDRGAHEAALDNGWGLAGYMPRDQRDELGRIPEEVARFLIPHESTSYMARTEANVRSAIALLLVVRDAGDPGATPGTARTLELATGLQLPRRIVTPSDDPGAIARWIWSDLLAVRTLPLPFLDEPLHLTPPRLLVAGPRESRWPGACAQTTALLRRVARVLAKIAHPLPQEQR